MIDHLLTFADEPTAQADLTVGRYFMPTSADGPGGWRGDVCIPGVSVYTVTGTTTVTDPTTGQTFQQETRQAFPGWFIVISLPALDPALRDLPANACALIADRGAAALGNTFMLFTASNISPAELAAAHVEPTFAGSNYPFGAAA